MKVTGVDTFVVDAGWRLRPLTSAWHWRPA